jgi:Mn2+/Fe2+ NRAMP family transporter
MSLEYYLQKQSGKELNCLYIPALFTLSIVVLFFMNGFDYDLTVKNRLIFSLSGLFLALFSVMTYSIIKNKVSAFRYNKTLSVISSAVASLIFGMATGAILQTCLG